MDVLNNWLKSNKSNMKWDISEKLCWNIILKPNGIMRKEVLEHISQNPGILRKDLVKFIVEFNYGEGTGSQHPGYYSTAFVGRDGPQSPWNASKKSGFIYEFTFRDEVKGFHLNDEGKIELKKLQKKFN